ncbi:isoprenylcysteine carboxylmethyltransferase family protein [Roseibium aggregatum]|uniref:methyltransferase family protein n=1 Tax=Roseibium aggregatum TaxID=187304 RepID=UPI002E2A5305|nr:isoprenylcysteine carboxylmethyltransferase family protein [Roseibium aggregatum]
MIEGFEEWTGLWSYAVLIIVLGAWGAYHFLAPKSWREWAGTGLVQSFIIALYAEMYGFPLTLYFLAGILPAETTLTHSSGHLWVTLLGYGRTGATIITIVSAVFILAGLLLIVKGWVKIYFLGDRLQTDGVYGLMRHPQYTGIFLLIFGQLLDWPTLPTLVLTPVIVWLYVHLAQKEEKKLLRQFGDSYTDYRQRVPIFFPKRDNLYQFWTQSEV